MKGVECFFDAKGNPKTVLIDLRKNPELWEDFRQLLDTEEERQRLVLFDRQGKPRAVLLNVRKYGDLWEDYNDILFLREQRNGPTVTWEEVKERLRKLGKIK